MASTPAECGVSPERPRVLVVAYCFPPHAAIGTHRTLRLINALAEGGWSVDVLSVEPDAFLAGTPRDESLLSRVPASVRVVRSRALRGFSRAGRWINRLRQRGRSAEPAVPAAVTAPAEDAPAGPPRGGLLRSAKGLIEELCALPDKDVGWLAPAVLRGLQAFQATPPAVIFSSAPPWTTHLVAGTLAALFDCRWVADFRDPWVRSPWTRYKTRIGSSLATRLERAVIGRANAVLFTTESARREFADHYGPAVAARLQVVFNGCDPSEFPIVDPPYRGETDSDTFTLLHAGTLYGGRSPLPLMQAVAAVSGSEAARGRRVELCFLGATGYPGLDVLRQTRELGLEGRIRFVGRVDRQVSLAQMQRASALVILQAGTSMAIPGKLYEYLVTGRPIFALCEDGEMAEFIRDHRLGVVVTSGHAADVVDGLNELLATPASEWVGAPPRLYDGRLRAAEMAAILARVIDPAVRPSVCAA